MMDGQGQEMASLRFANNRTGTADLEQQLAVLAESEGISSIHVAAEATNTYWLPLFDQLSRSATLEDWPLHLYPFNPRVIRHFKKALGDEEN
ncbi:MAG: IS110 family transposase [Chloroflexi bacterium]|nr:IS110 family transposase [Chloroflexota bacterium]